MFNSTGRGRNRKNLGLGIQGNCVCENCGYVTQHRRGVPCYEMTCPKCGNLLNREGIKGINRGDTNNKPRVDEGSCVGCGRCVDVCPVGAISMLDNKAHININSCVGCRKCVSVCPIFAIK